jgi:hypothetical protein
MAALMMNHIRDKHPVVASMIEATADDGEWSRQLIHGRVRINLFKYVFIFMEPVDAVISDDRIEVPDVLWIPWIGLNRQNDDERQIAFNTPTRLRFALKLRGLKILVHLFDCNRLMKRDGLYRHLFLPGTGTRFANPNAL